MFINFLIQFLGIQKYFDPLFETWNTVKIGGLKLNEKMSFSDLVTLAGIVGIQNAVGREPGKAMAAVIRY